MKNSKDKLLLEQLDKKLVLFKPLKESIVPQNGWINSIRTALKMTLRQLGNKLSISAQSAKGIEVRESNGSITLKSLSDVAHVLDMTLVYGFVSKHSSLEEMIEKRAHELAKTIVNRTNRTMSLEDQENSKERINKAIIQKTEEITYTMPKYLWD